MAANSSVILKNHQNLMRLEKSAFATIKRQTKIEIDILKDTEMFQIESDSDHSAETISTV